MPLLATTSVAVTRIAPPKSRLPGRPMDYAHLVTHLSFHITLSASANYNGLGIPACSNSKSVDIMDLYSGLRTIYTVIKRLFCLTTINAKNTVDTINPYRSSADPTAKGAVDTLYNQYATSGDTGAGFSDIRGLLLNQTKNSDGSILRLPVSGASGRCVLGNIYIGVDVSLQKCRTRRPDNSSVASSSMLSASYWNTLLANVPSKTITYYDSTGTGSTTAPSDTDCYTSTLVSTCNQAVQTVRIQFETDGSAITKATIQVMYANIASAYYTVSQSFEYWWKYTGQSNTRSSTMGYSYGSPLVLMNSNSVVQLSPLVVSDFTDFTGACITNSTKAESLLLDIRFGADTGIQCVGTNSTFVSKLANYFTKIGKVGAAVFTNSDDFINVTVSGTPQTNAILEIYYGRVGTKDNPMFEIVSSKITAYSAKTGDTSCWFFVEFKDVTNTAEIYVPPAPNAQLYLANDVLYPFYVY